MCCSMYFYEEKKERNNELLSHKTDTKCVCISKQVFWVYRNVKLGFLGFVARLLTNYCQSNTN